MHSYNYKVLNAKDVTITPKDPVLDELNSTILAQNIEIGHEIEAVAKKGDNERQAIKEKHDELEEQIRKVCALYTFLTVYHSIM